MPHDITYFPSLLRTNHYETKSLSALALVDWLKSFGPRPTKQTTDPGFGPYALGVGQARTNAYVLRLSLAVFDVDYRVTENSIATTDITFGDTFRVWYQSSSYTVDNPRSRLIVPFDGPGVPAVNWKALRSKMIREHKISADLNTSNSISHAYFVPSRGADSVRFMGNPDKLYSLGLFWYAPQKIVTDIGDYRPPETKNPELEHLRAKIVIRSQQLKRKKDLRYKLLDAMLAGESIGEQGTRDVQCTRVASILVYALYEEAGTEDILELMRPSLHTMQAQGSKLTEESLLRKIDSAFRKKRESELRISEVLRNF